MELYVRLLSSIEVDKDFQNVQILHRPLLIQAVSSGTKKEAVKNP